jgi:organic hydroperoxide reductase OsmC/OhrA
MTTGRSMASAHNEADIAAARTIMAEVKENCLISNSITADVKLTPQFRVSSDTVSQGVCS